MCGVSSRPAQQLKVARVAVDVPLPHLDRLFDYLVPESMSGLARPGVRVRVRFAGRLVGGFLVERAEGTAHTGRLASLQAVVSPEQVLTPAVLTLAREVADRYAGPLADVLRLAVPPRHARVEAETPSVEGSASGPLAVPDRPDPGGWGRYRHGPALLDAVAAGAAARAVWQTLPGASWADETARLVVTALAAGRGALVVVPDQRDLDQVDGAMRDLAGAEHHVVLTADLGPAERYRRWLQVLRGQRRAVIGTRAAAFAPVRDLGVAVIWDDGDDLHAEPRAPYPHVRTILGLRSRIEGAAFVVAGFSRTAEGAALVRSGWAHEVVADRATVRRHAPRVTTGSGDIGADAAARLPHGAWEAAHRALQQGPVLVQVPRAGYLPGLACATCRAPARCSRCAGPLRNPAPRAAPVCAWCAARAAGWSCPGCGERRLRATAVGSARTAEELGRAFPRVPVRSSGGGSDVLAAVPATPAVVVATPGAEPVADGGYAAALLLDGWALLARPDLRAGEEALRRWLGASALVRSAPQGGQVVVVADPAHPAVQALVRWDPAGHADRELAERATLHLPPAAVVATLTGEASALQELLRAADLPDDVEVLGPVPADRAGPQAPDASEEHRVLLRAPRRRRRDLTGALRAAAGVRSAHKAEGTVRIQVDPQEVG